LGGGYLTHYVEGTSLSIRDSGGSDATWSPPSYDSGSDWWFSSTSTNAFDHIPYPGVSESDISWEGPAEAEAEEIATDLVPEAAATTLAGPIGDVIGLISKSAFSSFCCLMFI
jgi:hypothetical protein